MKLGSHNSLTYLKPRKWWMYLYIPFAKCQSKTIEEQYEAGARYFDFRIRFDSKGPKNDIIVAHGLMEYKLSGAKLYEILDYLNRKAWSTPKQIHVRMLYEMSSGYLGGDHDAGEDSFIEYCKYIQTKFKSINFCGGQRKYDWAQLVKLGTHPMSIDLYSSRTWTILDDWCPWIYAKLMNKKNYKKYKGMEPKDGFMLMDFIDDKISK